MCAYAAAGLGWAVGGGCVLLRSANCCCRKPGTHSRFPEAHTMPVWPQIFITGPRHVPLCRLLQLLEDCNLCAIHAKRVTISEWPPLACLPACLSA